MLTLSRAGRCGVVAAVLVALAACSRTEPPEVTPARREAITDSLRTLIVGAYDLARPGDAVARLMSLYPDSGPVVSASGGRVTGSRDTLQAELRAFWENVGRNMREPRWTWGRMHVDVLSDDAAVLTTTYRVAHLTPAGAPHVIAGAWTAAFHRRGGRWVIVQEHLSEVPPEVLEAQPADTAAGAPAAHAH